MVTWLSWLWKLTKWSMAQKKATILLQQVHQAGRQAGRFDKIVYLWQKVKLKNLTQLNGGGELAGFITTEIRCIMQAFPEKMLPVTVWNRWFNLQECTITQEQEGFKWKWWWHLPFTTALSCINMSVQSVRKYTTCSIQLSYNVKHYLEYWQFLCHTAHQINVYITPLILTAAWYILSTNIH